MNTKREPPCLGWYKLNFDGAARQSQGLAVVGGVLRSHLGEMVASYTSNLNVYTSNQTEAMALAWGLRIVLSIGIHVIVIEGDSKLIIDGVKGLN